MSVYRKVGLGVVFLLVLVYMANPGCGRHMVETVHMLDVTEDTFAEKVEQADTWVLVDFWAPWCGPCRAMMPELDAVAATNAGRVVFTKVNIDENPGLAERFQVTSIPQVVLFRSGRAVSQFNGYQNRTQIQEWLDRQLAREDAS